MHPYQNLERSELIDMLASYTARYTEMMKLGSSMEEYEACKTTIMKLQEEINFRDLECDSISQNNKG